MNAINTAASGLQAASTRLLASASNVANMRSRGPIPEVDSAAPVRRQADAAPPPERAPEAYQPVESVQTPREDKAGVKALLKPSLPAFIPEYDPSAPFADKRGMVAAPDVDPVREMVSQMEALRSFRANMATVRTAAETEQSLLSLKA